MCNNKIMKKFYLLFISIMLTLNINAQTNDVGITEIVEPVLYICMGNTAVIKVKIKNFGTQTQTSIPLSFRRGVFIPQTSEVWNGVLLAGDSLIYTFQNQLIVPNGYIISLYAYTELTNDANNHNDTINEAKYIRSVSTPNAIFGLTNVSNGSVVTYTTDSSLNATNFHWDYTPSNGVTINSNGRTAIVSFGIGALSGVLSVYGYYSICHSSPMTLNISIGTGINEINNNSFLLAQNSPNPASTNTNIEYNLVTAGNVKVELINLLGEKLMLKTFIAEIGKNNFVLDVSGLPNGIYYYSMEFKGKKQFKKLVVSK